VVKSYAEDPSFFGAAFKKGKSARPGAKEEEKDKEKFK
jgi:hypothetical protein